MKALVALGAFCLIVKTDCETDGSFYSTISDSDHHSLVCYLLSMSVTRLVAVVEEEDTRTAITLCSSWLHTP